MEIDDHKKDHDRIIKMLDCSQEVAQLKVKLALLQEWKSEEKSDKEKQAKSQMWFGGMLFSIIMAVGASAIQQSATVQVLQEKVTEQKTEIKDLKDNFKTVTEQFNNALSGHSH